MQRHSHVVSICPHLSNLSSLPNFPRKFKWPPKHHHPRCNPPPPPPHRHRLHHLPDIIIPYIVSLIRSCIKLANLCPPPHNPSPIGASRHRIETQDETAKLKTLSQHISAAGSPIHRPDPPSGSVGLQSARFCSILPNCPPTNSTLSSNLL